MLKGVFLLEIFKLGSDRVKVSIDRNDMDKMGISFANFSARDRRGECFLQELLEMIHKARLIEISDGCVEVDVAETNKGTLNIYLRFVKSKSRSNQTELCYICDCPARLISLANALATEYGARITNDRLYSLTGGYALIFDIDYAKSTITKKAYLKDCSADRVLINKTAEYGELITTSPLEKLFALS